MYKNFIKRTSKSTFSANQMPRLSGMILRILLIVLMVLANVTVPAPAMAAVGDFSIDFVASSPFSYSHLVGGGAFDDRTVGKHADIVESLEAVDFACGDTITFLTQIVVDDTARAGTDQPQTIELDYEFLMDTTGQPGVALGDITYVGVNYPPIVDLIAGEDNVDQGIIDDGGSVATLISETQTAPMFSKGAKLLGTVRITDLDRAERVIVRVDTKLFCQPGKRPTGNLQAAITAGRLTYINGTTPVTPPGNISVGNQTIPFYQFGDIHYPEIVIQKTVTTAGGTCPGVESLTITAGDTVKFCYAVSNPSNLSNPPGAPLYDVSVVDDNATPGNASDDIIITLTSGLTDIDLDGSADDLAAGSTAYGEVLVTVTGPAGTQTNTATATGADSPFQPTWLTDTDTASVVIPAAPAIDIQKTPDTRTVIYGQTASFTIVVTNTGNVPLTNVTVTDPLAPNCAATIGSLAVGASSTYDCSLANVTSGFTNVATATGSYGTTNVSDLDDAVVTVDILPDISVTKTADYLGATPAVVPETGGYVNFTFVVTNHSSEPFILKSLIDDIFGDLTDEGTCTVPQTIAAG